MKEVARRHGATPSRVALAWLLSRPAISSVIIAARTIEHFDDNLSSVDLELTPDDVSMLDAASDPGIPYPRWMVLQHDTVEDPRLKTLHPEMFADGGPWKDSSRKWEG